MSQQSSLASCVASLRSSNALLGSSIDILDQGVNDFPRLCKVLATTRHFDLLPSSALSEAQSALLASLTPEVEGLLKTIDQAIDKLARREQSLIARSDLLEGRLSGYPSDIAGASSRRSRSSSLAGKIKPVDGEGEKRMLSERELIKFKALKARKERLQFAVERLGLQAGQRERQLRKSVAAQ